MTRFPVSLLIVTPLLASVLTSSANADDSSPAEQRPAVLSYDAGSSSLQNARAPAEPATASAADALVVTVTGTSIMSPQPVNTAPVLVVKDGTISWSAQPGATGYGSAVSTAPEGDSSRTTTYRSLGNVTSWSPTQQPGRTLYYGVASQGPSGDKWSAEVSITWPQPANTAPSAQPVNAAPVLGVKDGTISWSAQPGATGYGSAISTARAVDSSRTTTYRSLGNVTSWSPTPQPGKTLYYGVASQGPSGDKWSAEVSITWPQPASTAPLAQPASAGGGVSTTAIGMNAGGWGSGMIPDEMGVGGWIRWDSENGEPASDAWSQGAKLVFGIPGPYTTSGVKSINVASWTSMALSKYASASGCNASSVNCPALEVLNEPGGNWFWGSADQSDANNYAKLLQAAYTAFHNQYGESAPKILASYDGGHDSDINWGQLVTGNTVGVNVENYVDGWTMHPYGSCDSTKSTGHRNLVAQANANTGKPIWITELGWQTNSGSCNDSTEQQQADNIYSFGTWARTAGYIALWTYFGYRDYGNPGDNNWWGLERSREGNGTTDGSKKPGYSALASVANATACTVCTIPSNTSSPTISGSAATGSMLTAAPGSWTKNPTAYTYQWQRSASSGWSNINGATSSTYVLGSSDSGHSVRVVVTASNGGSGGANSSSAASAATTAVQ